jgi:VWFA-related protein
MNWQTRLGFVAGCALLGGLGVVTADLPASHRSFDQILFRSSTTQVMLDVVVTDKDDRPVEDLSSSDFEIRQNGKVQAISQFDFVKVPLGNRDVPSGSSFAADSAPAVNTRPTRETRAFAIVVDDATLLAHDIVPAKLLLRQFLRRTSARDLVALTYVNRSDLSQDFTTDLTRISSAAERMSEAMGSGAYNEMSTGGPVRLADDLSTVQVLTNVVKALSTAREVRRALLLVGRGTYAARFQHRLEWSRLYRSAQEAGIPVYSVDPSGLAAPELGFELPLESQMPWNRSDLDNKRRSGQQVMKEVASMTNGHAFINRADIIESVDLMVSENGSYYTLGFEPDPYKGDGKFQSVDVRVKRPGLKVRARKGYVSQPVTAVETDSTTGVSKRLGEGTPGGDLALTGIAVRLSPGDPDLVAIVDIPVGTSALDDQLAVEWLALDPDAHVKGRGSVTLAVPPGKAVRVAARMSVERSARVLRVGVSSRAQQQTGWIHIPLEPLQRNRDAVPATPILLSADRADTTPALAEVGDVQTLLPFVPSTQRTFASTDTLRLLCRFTGLPPAAGAALRIVRVTDESEVFAAVPAVAHGAAWADVTAVVALAAFTPGDYRIDVMADPSGKRTIRSTLIHVK